MSSSQNTCCLKENTHNYVLIICSTAAIDRIFGHHVNPKVLDTISPAAVASKVTEARQLCRACVTAAVRAPAWLNIDS